MKIKQIIIGSILLIVLICGGFVYLLHRQRQQSEAEKAELVDLQRQAMQEELDNISDEFLAQYNKLTINGREGSLTLNNDSLIQQLDAERVKVSRLLEELQQVKSTSASQIAKLSREVGTLRKVLKSYVQQIDSLQARNELLRAENKTIKANFERATTEVRQLSSEKNELTNKVNLAAKLDATAIRVEALDKRGKLTRKISKMQTLAVRFSLAKNITAEVGNKTVYARILTPSDELLDQGKGQFSFEGKNIAFSMSRQVEYNGEETPMVMYWQIEESLTPGTYRLTLFEGGNLIGSSNFTL